MNRPQNDPDEKNNNVSRFFRLEVIGFIIQTLVLVASLVAGYVKLESKVDALDNRFNEHTKQHGTYLQKDLWEIRNRFIDQKLDDISKKLDILIEERRTK